MSDTSDSQAAVARANRALGDKRADVVAAVDAARAKLAAGKSGGDGAPADERAALRNVDRPPVSADVDKALGKSRDEAVAIVEQATETLAGRGDTDQPPAPDTQPAPAPTEGRRELELRGREKKLVDGQQRLRREREEFDRYKAKVEEELREARASHELARRDPFAWFEQHHGIKREAFGIAANGKGAAGVDPQVGILLEQQAAQIRQLTTQLQQRDLRERTRERDDHRSRELDKFASEAKAGSTRWPLAARYNTDKLKARGWELAFDSARRGVTLSNEEVLDRIEEELSEIASLRTPKPDTPARPAPKSSEKTGSEAKPSQQPTLTSRGASDEPPAKVSPLKMNRRTLLEETVRAVNEARKPKAH